MNKESIYLVEQTPDGGLLIKYRHDNTFICELHSGNTPVMWHAYQAALKKGLSDYYMAGIVAGLLHCQLTQTVPVVENR